MKVYTEALCKSGPKTSLIQGLEEPSPTCFKAKEESVL